MEDSIRLPKNNCKEETIGMSMAERCSSISDETFNDFNSNDSGHIECSNNNSDSNSINNSTSNLIGIGDVSQLVINISNNNGIGDTSNNASSMSAEEMNYLVLYDDVGDDRSINSENQTTDSNPTREENDNQFNNYKNNNSSSSTVNDSSSNSFIINKTDSCNNSPNWNYCDNRIASKTDLTSQDIHLLETPASALQGEFVDKEHGQSTIRPIITIPTTTAATATHPGSLIGISSTSTDSTDNVESSSNINQDNNVDNNGSNKRSGKPNSFRRYTSRLEGMSISSSIRTGTRSMVSNATNFSASSQGSNVITGGYDVINSRTRSRKENLQTCCSRPFSRRTLRLRRQASLFRLYKWIDLTELHGMFTFYLIVHEGELGIDDILCYDWGPYDYSNWYWWRCIF